MKRGSFDTGIARGKPTLEDDSLRPEELAEGEVTTPSWVHSVFPDIGDRLPEDVVAELQKWHDHFLLQKKEDTVSRAEHAIGWTVNNLLSNVAFRESRREMAVEAADTPEEQREAGEYFDALFRDIDEALRATGQSIEDIRKMCDEHDRSRALRSLFPALVHLVRHTGRSVKELRNGYRPSPVEATV